MIEYHLDRALQQRKTEAKMEVIQQLKKSFYVNNCVTSVNTHSEAVAFVVTARQIMAEGKFDLRGWEYTAQEETYKWTSILGLLWDKEQDTLRLTHCGNFTLRHRLQREIYYLLLKKYLIALVCLLRYP